MSSAAVEPAIECRDLLVGYGGAPVCAPATFALAEGQALALVGPNGSGKSTLLRAVLGLGEPVSGHLRVLGEPVDERDLNFRARVCGVLDDDAWFPALTVREHLYLTARGHGVLAADAVVAGLLDEFGLGEQQHALPTALSSGQRRRLLLAAGFARPRDLLVLDEPEQRLDRATRDHLARRLLDELAMGGSVLLATHDADLVRQVADVAAYLSDDAVEVIGPDEAADRIAREPR